MRRISILVILIFVSLIFIGCSREDEYIYTSLNIEFGKYEVFEKTLKEEKTCEIPPTYFKLEESFDSERRFYVSCDGEGIVIKVDGDYMLLEDAFSGRVISSNQVLYYDVGVSYEKDKSQCLITNSDDERYMGTINDYEILRAFIVGLAVVGNITVDGYYFGSVDSGTTNDLNSIGYLAKKDDIQYKLQNLVDDGEMTTEDIYFKIFICDDDKLGYFSDVIFYD